LIEALECGFDQADIEASVERILDVVEKWMNRNAAGKLTPVEQKQAMKEIETAFLEEATRPPRK
jgi:hypothetical protein